MDGLNPKQREILVDVFSKIAVYISTVAVIGGVIEQKVDYRALILLLLIVIVMIVFSMYIARMD